MAKISKIICHGSPERCFRINGKPMPICSRCVGFYAGLFGSTIFNLLFHFIIDLHWLWVSVIFLGGLAPMAIDGFTQLRGWRESNNQLRLITGLTAGFSCGVAAAYIAVNLYRMLG